MELDLKLILAREKIKYLFGWLLKMRLAKKAISLVVKPTFKSSYYTSNLFVKRRICKGMNNIDMVYKTASLNLFGKVVLELGTGSHGTDLVLFYLLGAERIYTVDVSFYISKVLFLEVLNNFGNYISVISEISSIEKSLIESRYNNIKSIKEIDVLFSKMNIKFISFSDFFSSSIHLEKVDFFYSESTLQRIPITQIDSLFKRIDTFLKDTCFSFHRIDCRDINVQKKRYYHDPNLWRLKYLKYNNFIWNLMTTKTSGSQNRLRETDFIRLLCSVNLIPTFIESYIYCGDDDINNFNKTGLAKRFRNLSTIELSVSHTRVVCMRKKSQSETEYIRKIYKIRGSGLCYPPNRWNREKGLLEGTGIDD